ncbi:MAG: ABC transporter permease [Cyanobacteria bacterium KgW148]|nr:ABC transporter permease [Cyanobacteria bacterium KgW148]
MGKWHHNFPALCGVLTLGMLYTLVIFAGFFAPYGFNETDPNGSLLPPTPIYWLNVNNRSGFYVYPATQGAVDLTTGERTITIDRSQPTPIEFWRRGKLFTTTGVGKVHLLGTDEQGRDQLSRLLYGGRISLFIGIVATAISFTIGTLVGTIAGYFGGWVDLVLMRLAEVLMSVPKIYLLVGLAAILPPQLTSTQRFLLVICVLSSVGWAGLSRLIRGKVLSLRERPYVLASRVMGASALRTMIRHIMPQLSTDIIILATLEIPGLIEAESVLSLIGLGIQPPDPSWGNMLSIATNPAVIVFQPWLIWSPVILIIATTLAFNVVGDTLRDIFDSKSVSS